MTARTADGLLREATLRLAASGVATARADAELLLACALGDPDAPGEPDEPGVARPGRADAVRLSLLGSEVTPRVAERFADLVGRRANREPLQHLTGWAGFRELELRVGPGVFVPRPETEVVACLAVDEARLLAAAGESPLVTDLCSGSGAIAFAVASEVPRARVVGVELDSSAVGWSRDNLARLGLAGRVEVRHGDVRRAHEHVLRELCGEVDVVVSNPPYIPPDAEPVDPEVRDHDPVLALYGGGDDGLEVPAAVIATAAHLLRPGGLLVMEHAETQAAAARRLAVAPVWDGAHTVADLTGRPRALVARRGVTHSQP